MATVIRAEISENNKYWISKHRHYELKHFCLQYPYWKKAYSDYTGFGIVSKYSNEPMSVNAITDRTATQAMMKAYYSERIKMVERIAKETDDYLADYILKAVTEGLLYTYLKTKLGIPCSRDMFYDGYRRFYWLLSRARD